MYEGKQPAVVIGVLVLLLVIVGVTLVQRTDQGESALTGSTVIHVPEEQTSSETLPSVIETGSARVAFNSAGKTLIEEKIGEEIQVGTYLIKVVTIKATEKIGDYVTPEQFQGEYADKMFYVAQLQITNVGLKEGYAPPEMFHLNDGISEYGIDEDATKFFGPESILYPVLRTGVRRHLKFAFDVEPGMYALHMSTDGKTIYRVPFS